jgi:two-component system sensor histidine kinase DesK
MRLLPRKHVLQYDWLIHLFTAISALFPVAFFLSDSTANPWQLAVLYPLFILQWYHGFWQNDKHVFGHYLFLMLIASWAMSMHWSGAALFFYGQMFLLKLPKLWMASFALFAQGALVVSLAWVWQFPIVFSVVFFLLIVFGGHANFLFFKHVNAQRDMLIQQEELEYLSRERERERIARDLHDVLGHTLSTIALKAELSEKLLGAENTARAKQELADIAETARTALADVRQTVTGYRAGNLRSEMTMAQHSLSTAGIDVVLPEQLPVRISREMENLLSLVLREAITNVIRHARARQCRVQFFNRNRRWHLVVTDDGIGWNGQYGNGLSGMKERLAFHGGKLTIESLNPGTKLIAVVEQLIEEDVSETDEVH